MTLRPLVLGTMNDPWFLLRNGSQASPALLQPAAVDAVRRYREWSENDASEYTEQPEQQQSIREPKRVLNPQGFTEVASFLAQQADARLKSIQEQKQELRSNIWYRSKSIQVYREVTQGFPSQSPTTTIDFIA